MTGPAPSGVDEHAVDVEGNDNVIHGLQPGIQRFLVELSVAVTDNSTKKQSAASGDRATPWR